MNIAIIGTGNMGGAVARHLAKEHSLTLCNRGIEKGEALATEIGARFVKTPQEAVKGADWVVLAVKPKDLQEIGEQLALTKNQILLSVLGGVSLDALKKAFKILGKRQNIDEKTGAFFASDVKSVKNKNIILNKKF